MNLGSDKSLRLQLFTKASFAHPAKLHLGLLRWLGDRYTQPGQHIIDPMGGIGSTLLLAMEQRDVTILDVEERWLSLARENATRIRDAAGLFASRTAVIAHDARQPWPVTGDVVLFSPPYAKRASRTAQARSDTLPGRARALADGKLGERWRQFVAQPTPGADGAFRFHYGSHPAQIGHLRGETYWGAMADIYANARAALPDGGLMIVVIKDHIRAGQRVSIVDATVAQVLPIGFTLVDRHTRHLEQLSLWERRRKEQGIPVVEDEEALVFQRIPSEENIS